ncbi:MAG TPA: sigma 54-interacting transcriptional regulator [Vicinamibacterales bacterium]
MRRRAGADAATVLVRLGRLLVERGRSAEAVRVFESATALAEQAGDEALVAASRIWQASAWADARNLAAAEAACRDLRRDGRLSEPAHAWATSVLARVCIWQGRLAEARALVDEAPARRVADATTAFVEGTAVRVLLETGAVFEAGRRLDLAVATCTAPADSLVRVLLATARLRFACAVGDLAKADEALRVVRAEAGLLRLPLRVVRAELLHAVALRRGGLASEASRALGRIRRLARVLPPLLREDLERAARAGVPIGELTSGTVSRQPCSVGLTSLVEMCRGPSSSLETVTRGAHEIRALLGAHRVEMAADVVAPLPFVSVGTGPATTLAERVLAEGRPVGPLIVGECQEVAVPVRWESRTVAALTCRLGQPAADTTSWLSAAAAILAGRVEDCVRGLHQGRAQASLVPGLLGGSAAMATVRAAVARAAPAPFAVLVVGESGVGKELIARAVHALSGRRQERLCDLNCAALPDELVESELFGYVRGAFTGAMADRAGVFEEASGGTLFLDEVVDLSLRAQAKLLRVIQQQEVRRLGDSRCRPVDVRIISAANRDPRHVAQAGGFRADLVYRLDVIRIAVPPLRERREDVAELASHLWRAAVVRVGSRATLARDTLGALADYDWPGNVRELQNVLATMAVVAPREGRLDARHLPPHVTRPDAPSTPLRLEAARRDLDRRVVEAALSRTAGHRGRAARELGVSRQGRRKLLARVGVPGGARRRRT